MPRYIRVGREVLVQEGAGVCVIIKDADVCVRTFLRKDVAKSTLTLTRVGGRILCVASNSEADTRQMRVVPLYQMRRALDALELHAGDRGYCLSVVHSLAAGVAKQVLEQEG